MAQGGRVAATLPIAQAVERLDSQVLVDLVILDCDGVLGETEQYGHLSAFNQMWRELGVPCIIGTKIATQVLHDGDLVEVDADHGVVRVLEKKV